jgi:hypothetical protein
MSINLSISGDGKVKISTGSTKVRKDDLSKWLGRNRDAVLVKLEGQPAPSAPCSVGHICQIEDDPDNQRYDVFVGSHLIGYLPEEAMAFAEQVDTSPEFLISIVGKVEDDGIYIYVAE